MNRPKNYKKFRTWNLDLMNQFLLNGTSGDSKRMAKSFCPMIQVLQEKGYKNAPRVTKYFNYNGFGTEFTQQMSNSLISSSDKNKPNERECLRSNESHRDLMFTYSYETQGEKQTFASVKQFILDNLKESVGKFENMKNPIKEIIDNEKKSDKNQEAVAFQNNAQQIYTQQNPAQQIYAQPQTVLDNQQNSLQMYLFVDNQNDTNQTQEENDVQTQTFFGDQNQSLENFIGLLEDSSSQESHLETSYYELLGDDNCIFDF